MAQELEDVEAIETCVEKCIHTFERCLRSQRSEYQNKSHNIRTQTLSIYFFSFSTIKIRRSAKAVTEHLQCKSAPTRNIIIGTSKREDKCMKLLNFPNGSSNDLLLLSSFEVNKHHLT